MQKLELAGNGSIDDSFVKLFGVLVDSVTKTLHCKIIGSFEQKIFGILNSANQILVLTKMCNQLK